MEYAALGDFSSRTARFAFLLGHIALSIAITLSGEQVLRAQTPSQPPATGPQPFVYPALPEGFDPVSASAADLARYGFPARPPQGDPSYTRWAQAMANAKRHLDNPIFQNTGITHQRRRTGNAPPPQVGAGSTEAFTNWSGVDEVYSTPFFAQTNNGYGSIVVGAWDQPTLGYENCSYGPYKTWTWVGMDGSGDAVAGNNDVLQAGTAAEACSTQNYAWYEWYTDGCTVNTAAEPCYAWSVPNFTVSTGDDMYVTVTYNTTYPNGTAFIEDQTTGQYVSIGYSQPPGSAGSAYAGYSAEWIVERPTNSSNGQLYNLAHYYLPSTPNNWYWLYPSYLKFPSYYPPGLDTAGTFNVISMYCDPSSWNPSSACPLVGGYGQYISDAYYWSYYQTPPSGYGTEVLYFYTAGPALTQ